MSFIKKLSYSSMLLIYLLEGQCMSHEKSVTISAEFARAIQIASNEFAKKIDINWMKYDVIVNEEYNIYQVSFVSKIADKGDRGSPKNIPGFEIELNKKTFEITNSNFIR